MKEVTDERLLQLNQLGIIPGSHEEPEEFLRRAEYCLSLKQQLSTSLGQHIPFKVESEEDPAILENGCRISSNLYDVAPVWVPVFFSNYQLAPWQGGCAWIFQMQEDSPTGALFQLRQVFKKSKNYLGIYDRDELISHELVHVGRMVFEEPKFEEILAYKTSHYAWRRWLGPIVQSSTESLTFIILLIFIFIADISLVATGYTAAYKTLMWLKLVPAALIILALGRLWMRHHTFSSCLQHLKQTLGDESKAQAVTYRLEDLEISAFAKMTPSHILEYAKAKADSSLRWRLITKAYFQ